MYIDQHLSTSKTFEDKRDHRSYVRKFKYFIKIDRYIVGKIESCFLLF